MAKVSYLARLAAIVLASVVIAGLGLHFWTFVYNSDYAMIGLMAKRLLDTGTVPIFVWHVGYQGTLVEVPAVAAFYHLFGITPYTLNLAPALFFFILIAVYFRSVRITFGKSVAASAALVAVVSSPALYGAILRTQPNYTQTFIYGSALIWIYLAGLRRVLKGESAGRLPLFFGLLAGWAFYTYGQIVYFFFAIGLHASALVFRDLGFKRAPVRIHAAFVRSRIAWPLRILNWIGTADIALGLISLATGIHEAHAAGHVLAWNALSALSDGIKIAAPAWIFGFLRLYWPRREFWRGEFALVLGGFAVGIAPKLYYNFVLGQPSLGKLGSGGDLSLLVSRIEWFFASLARFYNLSWQEWPTIGLGLILTGVFAAFFRAQLTLWRGVATESLDRSALLEVSPWTGILPAAFLAFCSLDAVTNDSYGRYLLVVIYFGAVAVAWALDAAWKSRGRALAFALTVGVAAILLNNSLAFVREFQTVNERPEWLEIAEDLEARGPRTGYADYSVAYVATLYTKGEVQLEPLEKSYSPADIVRRVEAASPIALVELPGIRAVGATVGIHGIRYRVSEARNVGSHAILTLEKL